MGGAFGSHLNGLLAAVLLPCAQVLVRRGEQQISFSGSFLIF